MRNTADHASVQSDNRQSDNRNDCCSSIISNLGALVEQVRANMKLIELAIAGEASLGNQEAAASIVVLDDVTPRYVRPNAALNACNAGLGAALDLLRDIRTAKQEAAGAEDQPVCLTRCA
jgi:hypothetical protein